jgi:DNA-3-methyladenine glycosylase I
VAKRCEWALGDELNVRHHDEEWGVPAHDERFLFEMLTLEGAQAGLSWITILRKRDGYRTAFAEFDPDRIARFRPRDVERLMQDAGIVRNRAKIEATIVNARATLDLRDGPGLDAHLWSFVDGTPVQNRWRTVQEIPAETPTSKAMSKDLKKRGFGFVGPTICYAFMQSVGMVNDHVTTCFRYREVAG